MTHAIALLGGAITTALKAPDGYSSDNRSARLRLAMSEHIRRELAAGLVRAVHEAQNHPQSIGTALPIRHRAVSDCSAELLELAERLLVDPVDPDGIALVAELIEDSSSPLYQAGGDLRAAVVAARAALDGRTE